MGFFLIQLCFLGSQHNRRFSVVFWTLVYDIRDPGSYVSLYFSSQSPCLHLMWWPLFAVDCGPTDNSIKVFPCYFGLHNPSDVSMFLLVPNVAASQCCCLRGGGVSGQGHWETRWWKGGFLARCLSGNPKSIPPTVLYLKGW